MSLTAHHLELPIENGQSAGIAGDPWRGVLKQCWRYPPAAAAQRRQYREAGDVGTYHLLPPHSDPPPRYAAASRCFLRGGGLPYLVGDGGSPTRGKRLDRPPLSANGNSFTSVTVPPSSISGRRCRNNQNLPHQIEPANMLSYFGTARSRRIKSVPGSIRIWGARGAASIRVGEISR